MRGGGEACGVFAEGAGEAAEGTAAAGRGGLASSLATVAGLIPARPASCSWDSPRWRRKRRSRWPSMTVNHRRPGRLVWVVVISPAGCLPGRWARGRLDARCHWVR